MFPAVSGRLDPREGYRVFSALSRLDLFPHGDPSVQILPLADRLVVRTEDAANWDRELTLETSAGACRLDKPTIQPLSPAARLWCRFATIKGAASRDIFREMAAWQLKSKGIDRPLSVGHRDVIHVAGNRIVGYSLTVRNLDDRDSLHLLANGLGGRRRFGGGVFLPC